MRERERERVRESEREREREREIGERRESSLSLSGREGREGGREGRGGREGGEGRGGRELTAIKGAYSDRGQEAEVMEGWFNPPVSQCMQQHVVRVPTLVTMELVKQPVAWVEIVWVLCSDIS